MVKRKKVEPESKEEEKEKEGNVAAELAREAKEAGESKLFFVFDTRLKGVIFIRIREELAPLIDPHKVVNGVMEAIILRKEVKTRFTSRLLPVPIAFKANLETFKKNAKPLIDKWFAEYESTSVCLALHYSGS